MMPNSLPVLQRDVSAIKEALAVDFERILSELEKITEKVN
jgi:hypothetical protein